SGRQPWRRQSGGRQGRTTLRAAIMETNKLGGSNTISFGSLTGTITLDDTLKTLSIESNTTINGSGPNSLTVRRDPTSNVNFSIFKITSGCVATIDAMTVSNGKADTEGGGIENYGTLVLSNCWVNQNYAGLQGGGIYSSASASLQVIGGLVYGNTSDSYGGGIYASGSCDLQYTEIDNNKANSGGGLYS